MAFNGPDEQIAILICDDEKSFKIYPNPVQNILYVKGSSEAYSIEIYSLIGQLVKTVSNANEIDVSLLSQGVYLIRISNENVSTTQRFIKF